MIIEAGLIGVGLAMDALAVSMSDGLLLKKDRLRMAVTIALFFGVFQALMPAAGYFLGSILETIIERFAPFVALALLAFIGTKMLISGLRKKGKDGKEAMRLTLPMLAVQALATSIDAFMVGVSFVAMGYGYLELLFAVLTIGGVTFAISLAGALLGKRFSGILGNKAEVVGGAVLIAIGIKVFLEGVGVL
jgi:putative Mn2+ efflux pump MntP